MTQDTLSTLGTRLALLGKDKSKCPVQRLLEEMDQETADVLKNLLASNTVSITRLHHEIRSAGFSIAKDSLSYHRKGICRCAHD